MKYKSHQIPGKGRGKFLGFPTINLKIPTDFSIEEGIYAVTVQVGNQKLKGAMHYGPIPVFNETEKTLEIFIINAPVNFKLEDKSVVEFEQVKKIREIRTFPSPDQLSQQITRDVEEIRLILSS